MRQEAADTLADRYGARPVRDPLEAAADPRLDGVVVCTPEHLDEEATLAAIEAGKPVAVEKPLAHTVAGCERIRDRARGRGVPVLVGHVLRFEPRYALVCAAVEAGEIGSVQALRGERIGLVSDQAVLGWCLPERTPGFGLAGVTVIGEYGALRVLQGESGVLRVGPEGVGDVDAFWAPEVHGRLDGALTAEVAHFVACARGEAQPLCTAEDGTEAVRVSLALEASAAAGLPVDLPAPAT